MEYFAAKNGQGCNAAETIAWETESGQILIAITSHDRAHLEDRMARFMALSSDFRLNTIAGETNVGELRAKILKQREQGKLGVGLPGIYPLSDEHGLIPPGLVESAYVWAKYWMQEMDGGEAESMTLRASYNLAGHSHNSLVMMDVVSGSRTLTFVVILDPGPGEWRASQVSVDGVDYQVVTANGAPHKFEKKG